MNRDISLISTYESGVMQATASRILGRINSEFLSAYGLTPSQWYVIGYCYDAGSTGMPLSELMRLLDTSMPHITNTVNMLESKGILHKLTNAGDNRVKIAKLAPKYKKTVEEIESGLREELRTQLYAAGNITRQELSDYVIVLYKLSQTNKN